MSPMTIIKGVDLKKHKKYNSSKINLLHLIGKMDDRWIRTIVTIIINIYDNLYVCRLSTESKEVKYILSMAYKVWSKI